MKSVVADWLAVLWLCDMRSVFFSVVANDFIYIDYVVLYWLRSVVAKHSLG